MDGQTQIKLILWKDRSSWQYEVQRDLKPVLILRKNCPDMVASLREKQSLPINLFIRFWVHLQDTFRAGSLALADGQHDP